MRSKSLGALALAPTMVALCVAAAAPANATSNDDDAGWYHVDESYTAVKGEDCSGKVVEHYTSKERVLVEDDHGRLVPLPAEEGQEFDPAALDDGDRFVYQTQWGKVHWYAPRTHRQVKRDSSGDLQYTLTDGGADFKVLGVGTNYYVGTGVKGIVNTDGVQRAYIDDWAGDSATTLLHVTGHREQICYKLGLRPIDDRVGHDGGDDGHMAAERQHVAG